jgi:hypothetical protein
MNKNTLISCVRTAMRVVPALALNLSVHVRHVLAEPTPYKTYEFFLSAVEGLVSGVYNGLVGQDFVYAMDNLIEGQLRDAYIRAWVDDGHFTELPDYLQESLDFMVEEQQSHVVDFWHDIIDARVDGTSVAPLLRRAGMWANRWRDGYNEAVRQIALEEGKKLQWILGPTEHCSTCLALSQIVARASEWETSGFRPQGDMLVCGGFNCQCSLIPTDRRRSPDALTRLLDIATSARV